MLDFLTPSFNPIINNTCKTQTACLLFTGHILLGSSIIGASLIGTSFIEPSLSGMSLLGVDLTAISPVMGSGGTAIALEIPGGDASTRPITVSQWNPSDDDSDHRVNDVDNVLDEGAEDHSSEANDASDAASGDLLDPTVSPLQNLDRIDPHLPNPHLPNPHLPLHLGNPPQQLIDQLSQIDTAASNEDLETVMAFYSLNLQHSDGLTHEDLETMLTAFWESHDDLTYSTQITEWEQIEDGFMTTTVTTVTGQQSLGTAMVAFEASIESRQQMMGQMIVEQEILAEQSRIHLGEQPPTVRVLLPERVAIGQPFYFDAIVLEPIGDSLLMGTAFSDTVSPNNYTLVPALELDVLGAGGLFKVGDAPLTPSHEWVSGLVIREDGMTGVTQRLQVVNLSDL